MTDENLARTRVLLIAGFVILLFALVAAIALGQRYVMAQSWVQHTLEVRQLVQATRTSLSEAENDARSFILTHSLDDAAASAKSQHEFNERLGKLQTVVADNTAQVDRATAVGPIASRRFQLLEQGIDLGRDQKYDDAVKLIRSGRGDAITADIQNRLSTIDLEEQRLFAERQQRANSQFLFLSFFVGLTIVVSLGLGSLAYLTNNRYLAALRTRNEALQRESAAREEVEAQLRQSQKMDAIGRLAGGIAHDFNNMLAIIVGNIEMLVRRVGQGPERILPLANNALDGAKRAGVLTQRLLAFARQMPLAPRPLEPNRAVSGISEMLSRTLSERIQVETVLGAGVWRVNVDEPQLESALLNLAVNARDAMPDGGKLTLETSNSFLDERYTAAHGEVAPGQYVLISVTDNGVGMTPDIISKAFEPFFTTKEIGAGTGLGLSQVHGFIKQSGGHIKIYSEPGVGTTIKLYLPRYAGTSEPQLPERAAGLRSPLGATVLVVEDEEAVRKFVAEALTELGCSVLEAVDGEAAVALASDQSDIQVLLTDVVMPGKSGRQLADEIRQVRPNVSVIYMTGYTRNAIVHNGMLDSGTHLLTKPFTLAELEAQLKSLLADKSDPAQRPST